MLTANLAKQLQQSDYSFTTLPDGSAVMLDLHGESVLTFNGTAAFMLACLREGDGEAAIAEKVMRKYAVDAATVEADVTDFVVELAQAVGLGAED
ncbi:MAG TPA: PqqD family protein [Rhodanobacteraceae bacterium]|jgi:hypothetical protein|nr:PqqD family protein [Rhodanobacteraceae bacterium]